MIQRLQSQVVQWVFYHTCTIICSSLYIYYLLFEDHSLFSRRFFEKVMSLYGASIQEGFIIKSGLRWHAYSICFESAAFLDKKKCFQKEFQLITVCNTKEICKCAQIKDQTTHWHLIYENCLYHTFFTCIYALRPLYLCYKYIHFYFSETK